jgi:hypothetical protein
MNITKVLIIGTTVLFYNQRAINAQLVSAHGANSGIESIIDGVPYFASQKYEPSSLWEPAKTKGNTPSGGLQIGVSVIQPGFCRSQASAVQFLLISLNIVSVNASG